MIVAPTWLTALFFLVSLRRLSFPRALVSSTFRLPRRMPSFQQINLQDYLQDVKNALQPNVHISVQEKHRKAMLCCLSGYGNNRVAFDRSVRTFQTEGEWQHAKSFLEEHWDRLADKVSLEDAPQFCREQFRLDNFRERPAKMFTFLARGRAYQGQFALLLESVDAADLLDDYHAIFQSDPFDTIVLQRYIEHHVADDNGLRDKLLACLHVKFAASSAQPMDGGKFRGQAGEASLLEYLQSADTVTNGDVSCRILAPVYVVAQKSGRTISERCANVIELPADVDLHGTTSEFDAIIAHIQPVDNEEELPHVASLDQLWEAKATLNLVSIHDAMAKKFDALSNMLYDATSLIVTDQGSTSKPRRYSIDTKSSSTTPLLFGIYGYSIMSPSVAAQQLQVVLAESMLAQDPLVVEEAIETGQVSVSMDQSLNAIERTQQLARKLNPTVIVPLGDAMA